MKAMSIVDAVSYARVFGMTLDAMCGRSIDGLLAAVRTEPVHVLDAELVARILACSTKAEAQSLGAQDIAYEVGIADQVVSRDVVAQTRLKVEQHLSALGWRPPRG